MALIVDSFSDALNQDKFLLKTFVYALPVFFCINLYVSKNMVALCFFGFLTAVLLLALLSIGICNITTNKREILTFNFLSLFLTIVKLFFAVGFYASILLVIGLIVLSIKIPFDNQYFQICYKYFVIFFLFSIGFTPYLAFSKKLKIKEAYKFSLIQESSMDVLLALIFLIPQFIIVDAILIGAIWYVLWVIKIPVTSPIFTFYCAFIVVLNISALSSYLAQIAYTCIQGEDEDYRDTYYIKGTTRMNDNVKK